MTRIERNLRESWRGRARGLILAVATMASWTGMDFGPGVALEQARIREVHEAAQQVVESYELTGGGAAEYQAQRYLDRLEDMYMSGGSNVDAMNSEMN